MRIEKVSDTDYKLYVFNNQIDKNDVSSSVKKIVKKLQKRLKLKGFYRVLAYFKFDILFLQLIKVEDSFYKNTLDLRIVLIEELNIYFKTEDYFIIEKDDRVRYFDNNYYVLLNDYSFTDNFKLFEFGDLVFGSDIEELLINSVVI